MSERKYARSFGAEIAYALVGKSGFIFRGGDQRASSASVARYLSIGSIKLKRQYRACPDTFSASPSQIGIFDGVVI